MSRALITAIGIAYAYIALDQGVRGNLGMAIMYAGYSIGNVGLFMMAG